MCALLKGLYLFAIPTPFPVGNINVYFLEGEQPTLVDVPPKGSLFLDRLEKYLADTGYAIEDIKRIIITHPHFDHFGSAASIVDRSGAKVFIHRDAAVYLEHFPQEFLKDMAYYRSLLKKSGAPSELKPTVLLEDWILKYGSRTRISGYIAEGDVIEAVGGRFTILAVPGHTPWCLMLYNREENMAITGDFLLGHISSNALFQRPANTPPGYKPLKSYINSLDRICDLAPQIALPGHGEVIHDVKERIQNLLSYLAERKRSIRTILEGRRLTVYQLIRELFPYVNGHDVILALSEIHGFLELLEDERTIRLEHHGGVDICSGL
ncbi:MAG: gloB 2 [Deltaproteobacteria bacterium]|nr:gloB 2 [Deltaproteobacteria bacterium]